MYEEAGFGALDSAYTINAEEGKIYIIDNNMQQYVGEDGKIDTENGQLLLPPAPGIISCTFFPILHSGGV